MDRMGSQKKTSYAMLCYDWFSEEGKYSPRCQTMLSPMHMFFLKCCAFSLSENGEKCWFPTPSDVAPSFFFKPAFKVCLILGHSVKRNQFLVVKNFLPLWKNCLSRFQNRQDPHKTKIFRSHKSRLQQSSKFDQLSPHFCFGQNRWIYTQNRHP